MLRLDYTLDFTVLLRCVENISFAGLRSLWMLT